MTQVIHWNTGKDLHRKIKVRGHKIACGQREPLETKNTRTLRAG